MTDAPTLIPPLNVHLLGISHEVAQTLTPAEKRPKEYRTSNKTVVLTALNPYQNILPYDPLRKEIHLEALDNPVVVCNSSGQASDLYNGSTTVVSTPTFVVANQNGGNVPATGVAWQNPYSVTTQVVISANGATITNVVVNGISVGTAAGTYYVPAYGAISVTYSVAVPTWVWTGINIPVTVTSLANANGRIIIPQVGEYVIPGANEIWLAAAIYPSRVGISVVRNI